MENRITQTQHLSSLLEKVGINKDSVVDVNTLHQDILLSTEEIDKAVEIVRKSRDKMTAAGFVAGMVHDEEIDQIKFRLRSEKAAIRNHKRYMEKLNNPVQYKKLTSPILYRALLRRGFVIDKWNKDIVRNLCRYFAGEKPPQIKDPKDPEGLKMIDAYSLNKGVLLFGGNGVGKTELLNFFRRNSHNPYIVKSCRDITFEYESDGTDAINKYSNLIKTGDPGYYFGHSKLGLALEDLGTEDDKKNFGNLSNVVANIILSRYDRLYDYEKNPVLLGKTHATTNLNYNEILSRYGSRAASRLPEMFNIFKFDANAPDRRKTL